MIGAQCGGFVDKTGDFKGEVLLEDSFDRLRAAKRLVYTYKSMGCTGRVGMTGQLRTG